MKTINAIMKVLTALAAIAGAVYILAVYGDRIVAWAKALLAKAPQVPTPAAQTVPTAADAVPAEDDVSAEDFVDDAPAAEAVEAVVKADTISPVADESDFEG